MGHGEIRKAMRELEDQQSENHKHCLGQIALTNTAIELHRRARQKEIAGLCDRVHELEHRQKSLVAELKAAYSNRHDAEAALRERIVKLEGENAEIRKGQVANRDAIADIRFQFNALKRPLEHRVNLQGQVDVLQEHINELAVGEIDPLRQRIANLTGRLDYLAEAQKDHTDLQMQVTWLQGQVKKLDKHIDKLCMRVFDLENAPATEEDAGTVADVINQPEGSADTLENWGSADSSNKPDDEFWKAAWVPHSEKQRKERWQRKRRQTLVDYIENEIPGEPYPAEDVADTASRLLRKYRAVLETILEETLSQRAAFESIHKIRKIAKDAQGGGN